MPVDNTDLPRLVASVRGPEDALPCNLSDEWLEKISADLEAYMQAAPDEPEPDCSIAAPLYLILQLCEYHAAQAGRNTGHGFSVPVEELWTHFERYYIEISLEIVRRTTDLDAEPATLETILTDREIRYGWKDTFGREADRGCSF